jgi:hypothetical protein
MRARRGSPDPAEAATEGLLRFWRPAVIGYVRGQETRAQRGARHGVTQRVRYPDDSTKENSQALLKLILDGKMPDLLARPTSSK